MVCDIRTADQYQLSDDYIVIVRDRRSYEMPFKDPVLVFGGGGREGWISVDKEEPLTDFLSRLWRFGPQFDIESAVLERDSTGEDPVHIEFNVRDVLSGKEHSELTVRPGDRIGFPPLEWKVYVAGDVNKPGELDFHPGFTAERYIALAGGPNDRGSFDRLTIYSADGNKRGADRNSVVYRGDTIVVNRKMSSVLGSWFVGVTALTSLVLAVYAVTQ